MYAASTWRPRQVTVPQALSTVRVHLLSALSLAFFCVPFSAGESYCHLGISPRLDRIVTTEGGQRWAPAGFERSAKQICSFGRASDVEDDAYELGTMQAAKS